MALLSTRMDYAEISGVMIEMRSLDREMYKATEKALKYAAAPLVNDVRQAFPNKILSGMMVQSKTSRRKRGPYPVYKIGQVRRQVNSKVGGRRQGGTFPILKITQRNGAAMIYDMAQHQATPGATLSANLITTSQKNASRVMWPTVRKNLHKVEGAIMAELQKAEKVVQTRTGGYASQAKTTTRRTTSSAQTAFRRLGA
jgi:hypothetical protein